MPNRLSFEDAVRLFKEWGFQVDPGPNPEEVTLILQEDNYQTYAVHPAKMLPEMAEIALYIRCWNGASLYNTENTRASLTYD
jgi:hypothetical protein